MAAIHHQLLAIPASLELEHSQRRCRQHRGITQEIVGLIEKLVAGLLLMAFRQARPLAGSILVAVFALFHGQAHGLEIPVAVQALNYAAGFALTTAMLLFAGSFAGRCLQRLRAGWVLRGAGLASGGLGVWLLLGV